MVVFADVTFLVLNVHDLYKATENIVRYQWKKYCGVPVQGVFMPKAEFRPTKWDYALTYLLLISN